jgi:membrane-associated protein
MESIIQFIFEHAHQAHWIVFGCLMLAGLNIPISEDLMIIFSAVLAATVIPENTYKLFAAVFLGCYLSDWLCYWVGRLLGPKLWNIGWFARSIDRKRIDQIHSYYAKYGFLTLLIGRFIPFGVRNCLFLTAGLGKMHFGRFILSDGIACIISNSTLFYLAYTVGKNYHYLLSVIKTLNIFLFGAFVVAIIAFFWYKRKKKTATQNSDR